MKNCNFFSAKSGELENIDVEELFIDDRVQTLLQKLTGFNDEKIFAERSIEHAERSHFALMTDSMLEEVCFHISIATLYSSVSG